MKLPSKAVVLVLGVSGVVGLINQLLPVVVIGLIVYAINKKVDNKD